MKYKRKVNRVHVKHWFLKLFNTRTRIGSAFSILIPNCKYYFSETISINKLYKQSLVHCRLIPGPIYYTPAMHRGSWPIVVKYVNWCEILWSGYCFLLRVIAIDPQHLQSASHYWPCQPASQALASFIEMKRPNTDLSPHLHPTHPPETRPTPSSHVSSTLLD